jgi:hypothetical protein
MPSVLSFSAVTVDFPVSISAFLVATSASNLSFSQG